jgi:serpin B
MSFESEPTGFWIKSRRTTYGGKEIGGHMRKAAISNNEFTFDLYQKLKSEPGNIFYSPYSIFCALAMAYAGTGGATAREMAAVLHFDPTDVNHHKTMHDLQQDIERYNSRTTQIRVGNALWGQKGWDFLPGFLKLIEDNYSGAFKMVDFAKATEASRHEINQWVSKQTNHRINQILQPGSVSDSTTMIITNAIYFKARWAKEFEVRSTNG